MYNEYYLFGLQTANSWTRVNTTGNQFLYNEGTELNALTGLYDLEFRNYDPQLGRMHQVDPMADKYGSMTPYNYAFNDPVFWNDPTGADPNQDDAAAAEQARARAELWDALRQGYSMLGDDDLYGSVFARFGPGDGGALWGYMGAVAQIRAELSGYDYRALNIDINFEQLPENSQTTLIWTRGTLYAQQVYQKNMDPTLALIRAAGDELYNGNMRFSLACTTCPPPTKNPCPKCPIIGDTGNVLDAVAQGLLKIGDARSMTLYNQGWRKGLNGNYLLTGRNYSMFKNMPMTVKTKPLTSLATIGTGMSYTATFLNGASVVFDTYQFSTDQMSGLRYLYKLTGAGASMGAAYYLGGPYGAAVGILFMSAEKAWDYTEPLRNQIGWQYSQFVSGLSMWHR